MSSSLAEEDVELRDLVAKVLDSSGVLGKMKAQLRAHVYTALETGKVPLSSNLVNPNLRTFLETTTGRLIASLVREFLEFFELDFALAVFDPETNLGKDFQYRGRDKLIDALGLTELVDPNLPLLSEVMRLSKVSVLKSESPTPTLDSAAEDDNTSNQTSLIVDQQSSGFKKCRVVEESSEEISSESTPQLELNLQPTIMPQRPARAELTSPEPQPSATPTKQPSLGPSKQFSSLSPSKQEKSSLLSEPLKLRSGEGGALATSKSQHPCSEDKESKRETSFLGNLPPLGQLSLGDLPPLSASRPSSLAPLNKLAPLAKRSPEKKKSSLAEEVGKVAAGHAVSQLDASAAKGAEFKKSPEDKYSDDFSVSEDIEEDIDSFLNSALDDNNENFTQEEVVVNSDASLKADHVESL